MLTHRSPTRGACGTHHATADVPGPAPSTPPGVAGTQLAPSAPPSVSPSSLPSAPAGTTNAQGNGGDGQGGGVSRAVAAASTTAAASSTTAVTSSPPTAAAAAPSTGSAVRRAFVRLHLSIVLAGFTGVLGKCITLREGLLVWYRFGLTLLLLWGLLVWRGGVPRLSWRAAWPPVSAGVLLCLHWLFFYGSIKASNVSIGVVCFALVGFFTALVEPWWTRTSVSLRELLLGALTVLGVGCIFSFDVRYRLGIGLGVVSSLFAALYTVRNKITSAGRSAHAALFYQMLGGFGTSCVLLPAYIYYFDITYLVPTVWDALGLLCLSLFCTVGMMTLIIQALREISAFTVSLSFNLEPVYSMGIAMLCLGESKEVSIPFVIGVALIACSVLLQSYSAWQAHRRVSALRGGQDR